MEKNEKMSDTDSSVDHIEIESSISDELDLEYYTLQFSKPAFKFTKGTWITLSDNNFQFNRYLFQQFVIEMYCKRVRRFYPFFSKGEGLDVQIEVNGKIVTPDVVLFNSLGNVERMCEFKTFLFNEPDNEYLLALRKEAEDKYTSACEFQEIICDNLFPKSIGMKSNEEAIYLYMLNQFKDFFRKKPALFFQFEETKYKRNLPDPMSLVKEVLEDHVEFDLEYDADYLTFDEIIEQTLLNLDKIEEFAETHVMSPKEFPSYLPKSSNKPNIWKESLFNRTQNRLRTSSDRDKELDFGHTSNPFIKPFINKYIMNFDLTTERDSLLFINKINLFTLEQKLDEMFISSEFNSLIKNIFKVILYKNEEIMELRRLNRIKGFIRTEASKDSLQDLSMFNFGIKIESRNQLLNYIKELQTKLLNRIKSDLQIDNSILYVNKRGNISTIFSKDIQDICRINVSKREMFSNHNLRQQERLDEVVKIPIRNVISFNKNVRGLSFSNIKDENDAIEDLSDWEDLPKFWDEFSHPKLLESLNLPDFTDLYGDLKDLNEISNLLNSRSQDSFNLIREDKFLGLLTQYLMFTNAFNINQNKVKNKGSKSQEFNYFTVPFQQSLYISSVNPNEITSGTIIGIHFINKNKFKLTDDEVYKLENGVYGEHIIAELDSNYYICISKPFRMNLKHINQYRKVYGTYLGLKLSSIHFNFPINNWLKSLFLDYNRQLSLTADIIYIMYKQLFIDFNFGKFEFSKKLEKLRLKDIRVKWAFDIMKKHYNNELLDSSLHFKMNNDVNFKSHLFSCQLTNLQSYLTLVYLKQLFLKDDGPDETFKLMNFFYDELKYEAEFQKSPFYKFNYEKSMSVDQFIDKLYIIDEKGNLNWTPVSYYPDACYSGVKNIHDEAISKNPNINFDKTWNEVAVETGKPSKVNVPKEMHGFKDKKDPTTGKLHTPKVPGISSSNLSEALFTESLLFNQMLDDINNGLITDPENCWFSFRVRSGTDLVHNNLAPSMVELCLYEHLNYRKTYVLTMNLKVQSGYDKRNFYQQTLNARNFNKLRDESVRSLLKNCEEDMILVEGTQKYIKIEKHLNDINWNPGCLIISEDETKYGDTYPMMALKIMTKALYDSKFYDENEALFCLYSDEAIEERFIIPPAAGQTKLKEVIRKVKDKVVIKENELEKKILEQYQKYLTIFEDLTKFDKWLHLSVLDPVKGTLLVRRRNGFILGVINMGGSTLTAVHCRLTRFSLTALGLLDAIRCQTHSDDSILECNYPTLTIEDFKSLKISSLIRSAIINNYKIRREGSVITIGENSYDAKIISKLIICLSLFYPRMVGQRPSLLKWHCGPTGEVLQTYIFNGRCNPPLIRYLASISADLPNHSPKEDLYMMVGRIYDVLVNGGGTQLVNDTLLIFNCYINLIYGRKTSECSFNLPIQLGGLWYSIPSIILTQGFSAFNTRLFYLARLNENDKFLKRALILLRDTADIWRQNETYLGKHNLNSLLGEVYDLNINNEAIFGAPETERDFLISYSRSKKTEEGFKRLYTLGAKVIDGSIDQFIKSDYFKEEYEKAKDTEKIKILNKMFLAYGNTDKSFLNLKLINFLTKYSTRGFQENYIRIDVGTKIISTLGYQDRNYSNPFCDNIIERYGLKRFMNINEIITTFNFLVRDYKQLSLITSKKFFNAEMKLKSALLSELVSISVDNILSIRVLNDDIKDFKAYYVRYRESKGLTALSYNTQDLFLAYVQSQLKNIDVINTEVVKRKYRSDYIDGFLETYELFKLIVDDLKMPIDFILDNFRMLLKMFSFKDFHGVVKSFFDANAFENSIGKFMTYSHSTPMKFKRITPIENQIRTAVLTKDISKRIRATFLDITLRDLSYRRFINEQIFSNTKLFFKYKGSIVNPIKLIEVTDLPYTTKFTRFEYNKFMLGNICTNCEIDITGKDPLTNRLTFFIRASSSNSKKNIDTFEYGVDYFHNKRNDIVVIKRRFDLDQKRWVFSAITNVYIVNFIDFWIRSLSYIFDNRSIRIQNLNVFRVDDGSGDFSLFGSDFVTAEYGNLAISYMPNLYEFIEDTSGYVYSRYNGNRFELYLNGNLKTILSSENSTFLITPWEISNYAHDIEVFRDTQSNKIYHDKNIDLDINFNMLIEDVVLDEDEMLYNDLISSNKISELKDYIIKPTLKFKIKLYNEFIRTFRVFDKLFPNIDRANLDSLLLIRRFEIYIGINIYYLTYFSFISEYFNDESRTEFYSIIRLVKNRVEIAEKKTFNMKSRIKRVKNTIREFKDGKEVPSTLFDLDIDLFISTVINKFVRKQLNGYSLEEKDLGVITELSLGLTQECINEFIYYYIYQGDLEEFDLSLFTMSVLKSLIVNLNRYSYLKVLDAERRAEEDEEVDSFLLERDYLRRFNEIAGLNYDVFLNICKILINFILLSEESDEIENSVMEDIQLLNFTKRITTNISSIPLILRGAIDEIIYKFILKTFPKSNVLKLIDEYFNKV